MKRSLITLISLFLAAITILMFQNCSQNSLSQQAVNESNGPAASNNLTAAVVDQSDLNNIVRGDEQVEQNGFFLAELSCVNDICQARKLKNSELTQIASQVVACKAGSYMASEIISGKYYGCVHFSMIENSGLIAVMMQNAYDNFLNK